MTDPIALLSPRHCLELLEHDALFICGTCGLVWPAAHEHVSIATLRCPGAWRPLRPSELAQLRARAGAGGRAAGVRRVE